jgi:hypothetical protein
MQDRYLPWRWEPLHGGKTTPNPMKSVTVTSFIEINATDEDAGWQGLLDASPWRSARILGPDKDDDDDDDDDGKGHNGKGHNGKELLAVDAAAELRKHGMTEYRWESAEPTFDGDNGELPLERFLARFPEGEYQCHVEFVHGKPKRAMEEDELTHCLPDGPANITISGDGGGDWTVMWDAVTTQYDQAGPGEGPPLDCEPLVKYSVTVELENAINKVMTFDVLPTSTMATVPGDFLPDCDTEGKVEIGAFVASGNSTFREGGIEDICTP